MTASLDAASSHSRSWRRWSGVIRARWLAPVLVLLLVVPVYRTAQDLLGPRIWEPIDFGEVEIAARRSDPAAMVPVDEAVVASGWPADVSRPAFLSVSGPSYANGDDYRQITFSKKSRFDIDDLAPYVAHLYERGFEPDLSTDAPGDFVRDGTDWIVFVNNPAKGDPKLARGIRVHWTDEPTHLRVDATDAPG